MIEQDDQIKLNFNALPRSSASNRPFNFKEDATWRIFRIMAEFIEGFQFLADFKKTVTFFGSGRCSVGSEIYQKAYRLAKMLGKAGFTIITGGGVGIMEAGNRGAAESQAESIGLNIQLPYEQRINKYVKKGIGFHYFFTRKVMLSASAQAYVFFPGGFGTLDEFFEIITLIQTKKIAEKIPVVLVGKDFWQPLLGWINKKMFKKYQVIDNIDQKIYQLADTSTEAFEIIKKSKERRYF